MTPRHRPFSYLEMIWEVFRCNPREGAALLRTFPRSVWLLPPVVVAWLYFGSAAAASGFAGWGLSQWAARLVAGALIAIGLLVLAMVLGLVLTGEYSRMRPSNALLAVAATPGAICVGALLNTRYGLPLPLALAVGSAFSCAAFTYVRNRVAAVPTPVRVAIWLDDPTRAEKLVRECEQELLDPSLTSDERAAVQVNIAGGLAVLASHSDRDDALPSAYEILAHALRSVEPKEGPLEVYIAAARLSEAMAVKATRTGDLEGYEESLQLMLDAASVTAQIAPGVLPRALLIHGTHLAALSARAAADGQRGRAARLRAEAIDDLQRAIDRSSPRRTVHALAQLELAALVDRANGDLDAAVDHCRVALRRLRLRSRHHRCFARLVLCDLLAARAAGAARAPASTARDLAEAARLCRGLHRDTARRVEAARRLPVLLWRGGAGVDEVARAYRDAFAELSLMSGSGAGEIAAEWAGWAPTRVEAAEAHWCWVRAVADDIRRRPLRVEKERRLAQVLGVAATAGERLLEAGRDCDAAVALDLGRATLLTELMHRDRDAIGERLLAAGHRELADRWNEGLELTALADRAAFAPGHATANTMLVGGHRFQQQFTTTDHLALADREQLLREISRVPGLERIDAPPNYDDLRAAAADGPLVYLSTTTSATHAVIVTNAPQPHVLKLPLTTVALDRHTNPANSEWVALARWLWDDVIGPVAAALTPGSLVTLIPLGRLSLLPLHIAGMTRDDNGIWRDRTNQLTFRYAPNARVLHRAQTQARTLDPQTLRVLTVAAPDAPRRPRLEHAQAESDGVLARFADRAEQPEPSPTAILDAMDRCGIWHFACHGNHDPTNPLESSLALRDGPLKLRTIFAQPRGSRRLAVLSACDTATPGTTLIDETIGFPSALLAAGVAGVVSTQANVDDTAATLLILRFFDELSNGTPPPQALTNAQYWLSNATNAQIHTALPHTYPTPTPEPKHWKHTRVFTHPDSWAPFTYTGA